MSFQATGVFFWLLGISKSASVMNHLIVSFFRILVEVTFVILFCVYFLKIKIGNIPRMMGIKKDGFKKGIKIGLLFFLAETFLFFLVLTIMAITSIEGIIDFYKGFFNGPGSVIFTTFMDFEFSMLFLLSLFVQSMGAYSEEFITRGLAINTLAPKNRRKELIMSIIVGSIFFSFFHTGNAFNNGYSLIGGMIYFLEKFLGGVIYSIVFILSKRNIVGVGLYHLLSNITLFNLTVFIYAFSGLF